MKKLQSNFTTPEQSKRLLEIGVPADSADCIMKNNEHVYKYNFDMEPTMTQLIERLNTDDYSHVYNPCWSVGRLIEILMICGNGDDVKFFYYEGINIMDFAIRQIEVELKYDRLDFSKLNDYETTE